MPPLPRVAATKLNGHRCERYGSFCISASLLSYLLFPFYFIFAEASGVPTASRAHAGARRAHLHAAQRLYVLVNDVCWRTGQNLDEYFFFPCFFLFFFSLMLTLSSHRICLCLYSRFFSHSFFFLGCCYFPFCVAPSLSSCLAHIMTCIV